MMTQHYTGLRFFTYLVIFIFHISVLFLLYSYSTKSYQEHLTPDSYAQEQSESGNLAQAGSQEATVSFEQEENQLAKKVVLEQPAPLELTKSLAFQQEHETVNQADIMPAKLVLENTQKEHSIKVSLIESPEQKLISQSEPATKQFEQSRTAVNLNYSNSVHTNVPQTYTPSSTTQPATTRSAISPAAFFQAFKNSYYQEQSSLGNSQSVNSPSHSINGNNSPYAQESLVNERLGELKISDYIQKIKKAFQEAARRTPGMYLNSGKELKTDLNVNLEIQNKGTVRIAKFQTSGITEVDDYIKRFLRDIIVSPIPQRFKVSALPFATKILINIDKNTRFYTLRCFF